MSENKTAKTPADGPVAWGCQCGRAYTVTCISSKPPKREWVGLTDEELAEINGVEMKYIGTGEYVIHGEYEFAKAIEAKLKEKNKW